MFSFLLSRHRKKPVATEAQKQDFSKLSRKLGNTLLPKTMRFRELRMAHIDTVGVYRSPIHGRGLFSKRHIDEEQMIIEYTGHVVRSSLTDQREKYYESKVSPAFTNIALGSREVIRHVLFRASVATCSESTTTTSSTRLCLVRLRASSTTRAIPTATPRSLRSTAPNTSSFSH